MSSISTVTSAVAAIGLETANASVIISSPSIQQKSFLGDPDWNQPDFPHDDFLHHMDKKIKSIDSDKSESSSGDTTFWIIFGISMLGTCCCIFVPLGLYLGGFCCVINAMNNQSNDRYGGRVLSDGANPPPPPPPGYGQPVVYGQPGYYNQVPGAVYPAQPPMAGPVQV